MYRLLTVTFLCRVFIRGVQARHGLPSLILVASTMHKAVDNVHLTRGTMHQVDTVMMSKQTHEVVG